MRIRIRIRKQRPSKTQRARQRGLCPHTSAPCVHSRECTLKRDEACHRLCANIVTSCHKCRRRGPCAFTCFRSTRQP